MKGRRANKRPTRRGAGQAPGIDELYGLEPVFEPDSHGDSSAGGDSREPATGSRLQRVECPYCGEPFETVLDLSGGSASYVEDCQICCRPIEFRLEVDQGGRLARLEVLRGD
jgi:hypothetical protein